MEVVEELKRSTNKPEIKKGMVSVVIPIYGSFDIQRLFLTIESIKNQEGVDIEIIVSEQGESPKLKEKLDNSVKYTFTQHIPSLDLSDFNPGNVRNLAIKQTSGEFIYTIDADVIFLDKYFLKKSKELLEQNPRLVLYRPFMRRLPLENFEEFTEMVENKGIRNTIKSLNISQEYLATTEGVKRELKVVTKDTDEYEKTFTTSMDEFKRYISDDSLKGQEPKIWSENRHCGSNFFRREQFEIVGGYCEDFINWGCEDSDLQWKLKEVFDLQFFPGEEKFMVMHLDHEMGYFSPEMWKRNEEICSERKQKRILKVAKEDQEKWKNRK